MSHFDTIPGNFDKKNDATAQYMIQLRDRQIEVDGEEIELYFNEYRKNFYGDVFNSQELVKNEDGKPKKFFIVPKISGNPKYLFEKDGETADVDIEVSSAIECSVRSSDDFPEGSYFSLPIEFGNYKIVNQWRVVSQFIDTTETSVVDKKIYCVPLRQRGQDLTEEIGESFSEDFNEEGLGINNDELLVR